MISALTTSRVMPLPAAERISARFQPNVNALRAGRAASRIAQIDAARAPASLSMCPASASSATDPDAAATTTSTTMKPTIRTSATRR